MAKALDNTREACDRWLELAKETTGKDAWGSMTEQALQPSLPFPDD